MKIFRIVLAILFALNLSSAKEQAMINFNELPHAAKLNGALSDKQLSLVSVLLICGRRRWGQTKRRVVKRKRCPNFVYRS